MKMFGIFFSNSIKLERFTGALTGAVYFTFALVYLIIHFVVSDERNFAYLGGTFVVIPFAISDFVAAMLYLRENKLNKSHFDLVVRRHFIVSGVFVVVTLIYTIAAIPLKGSLSALFLRGALSIAPFIFAYAFGPPWMRAMKRLKTTDNVSCYVHASKSAYALTFCIFVIFYGISYTILRVRRGAENREVVIVLGSFLSIIPFAVAGAFAAKCMCCCGVVVSDSKPTKIEGIYVFRSFIGFLLMTIVYFITYSLTQNNEVVEDAFLEAGISTTPFAVATLTGSLITLLCVHPPH